MAVECLEFGDLSDERLGEVFARDGVVVIRGGIENEAVSGFRDSLGALISERLRSIGRIRPPTDDLDALYNQLVEADRSFGNELAFISRDIPEYHRMLGDPGIMRCVRAVIGVKRFLMPFDVCLMRIDAPNYDVKNFDWHYDYPYNMLSAEAVTVWVPLTPVTEEMGQLQVVVGSHNRIWPVELRSSMIGGKGTGHKAFQLSDVSIDELEERRSAIPALAGDIVLLSPFLLHRSDLNRSRRSRWVFNPRYCNALSPELVGRGWRCVRLSAPMVFREIHPELVHAEQ